MSTVGTPKSPCIPWQFGEARGEAEVLISDRIAWQVERHFGRYGRFEDTGDGRLFITPYANQRALLSWVLGLGEHARLVGPPELVQALGDRVARLEELHRGEPRLGPVLEPDAEGRLEAPEPAGAEDEPGGHEAAIRPERFARLVTLASILIEAGRAGQTPHVAEVCERLQISDQELRDDISVLNVVNFGAGSYILYAEVTPDGSIEVDPDAYSDSFARPARLLPIEAKALVAAIDLIGEHIPKGSLTSARDKIVTALGEDPVDEGLQVASSAGDDSEIAAVVSAAIAGRRLLAIEYYKENEDEFSQREVEPYALMNGREGWYVAAFDPSRDSVRHFRLDRIKRATVSDARFDPRPEIDPAADLDGWPRTGEVEASRRARVWVSADRARWAREERPVVAELADGSVVVELAFAGAGWLVREVLKEVGDAAVLEPAEAREAVRDAAARLGAAAVSA